MSMCLGHDCNSYGARAGHNEKSKGCRSMSVCLGHDCKCYGARAGHRL